jgi:predicted transcriptional regulator
MGEALCGSRPPLNVFGRIRTDKSSALPDDLFDAADPLADRLGVSRSELYARAVAEYVAKHREEDVTAQLNKVLQVQNQREPGVHLGHEAHWNTPGSFGEEIEVQGDKLREVAQAFQRRAVGSQTRVRLGPALPRRAGRVIRLARAAADGR